MNLWQTLGWAEAFLWLGGAAALGYSGYILTEARNAQSRGDRELAAAAASYSPSGEPRIKSDPNLKSGALVGRLEIRRLGISVVIFEGTGQQVLDIGAGHLTVSPLPGEGGNMVLAAHRDTYFRHLRDVAKGDLVSVTTANVSRQYQVQATRIVDPDDAGVLAPTAEPSLTLVTCYPFSYIGAAPQRFIVQATELAPDDVGQRSLARLSR